MTRIWTDGTMYRRIVDTAQQSDPWKWADLTARALAAQPPYRPVPGTAVYHVCADGCTVQVGEYDLDGPLRDLVTVVLAMGREPGNDHEILGSALTEDLSVPAGWTGFADPFWRTNWRMKRSTALLSPTGKRTVIPGSAANAAADQPPRTRLAIDRRPASR